MSSSPQLRFGLNFRESSVRVRLLTVQMMSHGCHDLLVDLILAATALTRSMLY